MQRLPFDLILSELIRVLMSLGFSEARARQSATLFAETHLDGVASHGLNRFPRFVRQVRAGVVHVDAEPTRVASFGPWEQWDGNLGPGNLNATAATSRAIALARERGLGLVALGNTNHWMRGGTYGMFGVVLVQPMKAKPASAACQPVRAAAHPVIRVAERDEPEPVLARKGDGAGRRGGRVPDFLGPEIAVPLFPRPERGQRASARRPRGRRRRGPA